MNLLTKREIDEYQSLTAQLLYLSKRGHPDLQTSIVFHCTRVCQPDEDGDKKLANIIRYREKTKSLPLILSIGKDVIIEWWVDAICVVHNDMKSRTGVIISLEKGATYATLSKQKIGTTSFTYAELDEASDAMKKYYGFVASWRHSDIPLKMYMTIKTMRVQ